MATYLNRMPVGIAGAISRPHDITVEPNMLDSTRAFAAYGLAGKYDADYFVPLAHGDTADKVMGIYVRPYPTTSTPNKIQQIGTDKNFTGDALKRGYIMVNVGEDATGIKKGDKVYVRVAAETEHSPLGAFLLAADGTNTVELTNAYFTGAGDETGNTELAYNL